MKKFLILWITVSIFLVGCGTTSKPNHLIISKPPVRVQATQPQVCTEEAKICPDGSAVGRTWPDCTFAKCPGE